MAEDKLIGFKINSKGYGTIPKLVMQDRKLSIGAKGLYSYFCSFSGGGDTCFPSRNKICFDLCISIDTFGKYLKQLIDNGYIQCEQIKENGRFSHNVYTLCDTILPCTKISDTVNSVYEKTDTNNNSINNNSINNKNNKKERKKESKPTFDELIDNYTENKQLRDELKEHLKTRKAKKATLTNRAIELSLNKLDSLTTNDSEKILIVQKAIESGWTTFYPLKPNEKPQKEQSYNLKEYEEMTQEEMIAKLYG